MGPTLPPCGQTRRTDEIRKGKHVEFDVFTSELAQLPALQPKSPTQWQPGRGAAVRVTAKLETSPERVFDAWLDPGIAGKWLFATASRPMTRVTIDARVGGAFLFVDRNDGEHIEHSGVYIEIVRPRRLVFTLSDDDHRQAITRVTVEIAPILRDSRGMGGGRRPHALQVEGARTPRFTGCEVTVTHEEVPTEYANRMEARWTGILHGLGVSLNPQPGRGNSSMPRKNGRSR